MQKEKNIKGFDLVKLIIQVGTLAISFTVFILNQNAKLALLNNELKHMNNKLNRIEIITDDLIPRVIKLETK